MKTQQEYLQEQTNNEPQYSVSSDLNNGHDIVIKIQARESRGSALKKHTVYNIKGVDKNGQVNVWRRFNQFNQLRVAMVKAWPGCLIPSLPSKNPLTKNQQEINKKRERYLDHFLKKMALRPYLYFSEEFQAFLRSTEQNLSQAFSKWPAPIPESIINRYKQTFSILSGKTVTSNTITQIFNFAKVLQSNHELLLEYRKLVKELAVTKDVYNHFYKNFFTLVKQYELTIMSEYVDSPIYDKEDEQKVNENIQKVNEYTKANPYWMLYDLIKNEERDARAFIQLLKSIEYYGGMAKDYESKIKGNIKGISDTSQDKLNLKTLTMKGTPEEKKYQLQMQNESLKKQRQRSVSLRDIITALVGYIQIKQYKEAKMQFYQNTIYKFSIFECAFAENMKVIWAKIQEGIEEVCRPFIQ